MSTKLDRERGDMVARDDVARELDELRDEVRRLRERLAATESGRWWRLNPRLAAWRAVSRFAGSAFPTDFDQTDIDLCTRVGPYTMTSPERIFALVRSVEHVVASRVPGAVVECGVWRGGSMMAVALTLLRLGVTDRELYLYDTFAGMPEPGAVDVKHSGTPAADVLARSRRRSNVWAIASLGEVREAVLSVGYPEERIHFVRGLVEETLPATAPRQIALLRLDTDWYASTKHELVHLYPRLARGGVLILDDYGFWQGARKAVDEYFAEIDAPPLLNRIDDTARIGVKP